MNKSIKKVIKVGLGAGALAAMLTGCCLWSSNKGCCKPTCECRCPGKCCDGTKKHGVNTSMTLGVGTDGINASSTSNVGNHGMSANVGTSVDGNGMKAGAGGGLH